MLLPLGDGLILGVIFTIWSAFTSNGQTLYPSYRLSDYCQFICEIIGSFQGGSYFGKINPEVDLSLPRRKIPETSRVTDCEIYSTFLIV